MLVNLLFVFSAIHCLLFLESFRWADNSHWRVWFLRLVLFTMAYANLIQGLGGLFIEQAWFLMANYARYYLQVCVFPVFIVFALSVTKDTAATLARQPWFRGLCLVMTAIGLVYGAYHELLGMDLVVHDALGIIRLDTADTTASYARLLTSLFVLLLATVIWQISGWKWLFLGCLLLVVVSGLSSGQAWGFVANNLAEILFVAATLQTEKYFAHKRI